VTAELILRSHALPVEISELSVLLNSNLSLHLAKENRRLSGELVILEGEYTRDVDINPIAAVTERTRKVALLEKHADQGLLDSIEMDIAIKSRQALVVDNNISLLQLKPDLHIQGSAAQPVFTGRAEVDSGTISYQGREFTVTKGVVDFINPYKIEPHIDVEGEAQIRQWKIYLTVKGVPENLKVTLRSEPDLPNGDILSLLVFGKTVREFIEGEGGQSASPAELLAALMSDRLQTGVKDATGLDSVEVGYSSNGSESDSSRMKIEVGKDLSRYVTVKYGIETTNSKIVQRAITEYRFLEHLILEAYQNSEGDYGSELQYRLEFR
jgi:autotransporter translocation and assembly factor TamB